ncbi:phosphotransferase family protein [Lentzea sp. CA-135723]|uniref:phosphotransferase family protein n=1 Tax=Lentzea sp. CA-135723 TaxID=3239950 RepID=UPI003D8F2B96
MTTSHQEVDVLDPLAVDAVVREVLRLHEERTGTDAGAVDFTTWIPAGARKSRRRLFVRVDVDGAPVGVAKVPLAAHDPKVAFEYQVLQGLGPEIPFDHPLPLGRLPHGFVMTHLPGVDLPSAPGLTDGPDECWRVLRPVVESIAALHLAPADPAAVAMTPEQAAAQYVRRPFTGVQHADDALRGALLARTHGDLGPWNVRYEPETGRVRILDFEDYRPLGVAGIDLVNMLVTCALPVFPDYGARGFDWLYEQVFESDHWFRDVVATGLRHYARLTDQSAAGVADLTPLMCQWLIERITAEGRDTSHMFYRTFADRYLGHRPAWVRSLDV